VGLSFYAVVGGVVQELLEREGYTVAVVHGAHAGIFPRLGAGEVDILAAAWLPHGHATLYSAVEKVTIRIAPLFIFREAIEAKRYIVFPLWQPHWVNTGYRVRRLADPYKAYGEPDTAYLLGHRSLRDKLPPGVIRRLSNIRLSIDDVTEMDRMVNVDGLTPRAAAQRWMAENASVVHGWASAD